MATTWNPSDLIGVDLSGGDLVATGHSFSFNGVRATNAGHSTTGSEKLYFEVTCNSSFSDFRSLFGIGDELGNLGQDHLGASHQLFLNEAGTTIGEQGIGLSSVSFGPINGQTFGIAVDTGAQMFWMTNDGVTWNSGGLNDPATGVSDISAPAFNWSANFTGSDLYPMATIIDGGASMTLNAGGSPFAYALPVGFVAWDTPPPSSGGALVEVTTSISDSGVVHLSAIDGGAIYEFIASPVQSQIYLVADYDSIYSRGDRVANGLLAAGQYGWSSVFSSGVQGFDNIFGANGPAASGGDPGAAFWFSTVAGETLDIRGFTLIGADEINSLENFWSFHGGISPGNYSAESYFRLLSAYNPNQLTVIGSPDFASTRYVSAYEDEPVFYNQYAHFEFVYIGGPRPDVRWAEEIWLKVAHSNLDGGDRRESTAGPSRKVKWTNSADWGFRVASGFTTPNEGFFDGLWEYVADKLNVSPGTAADDTQPVTTVGAWFGFEFPRAVIPKHILFVNFNNGMESYDSGDMPQHYGLWHWEYSANSGASWTQIGGSWSFRADCAYMLAPREPNFNLGPVGPDGHGVTHWRMVLEAGPAWGGIKAACQIIFDLDDVTGQAPPYVVSFTDDTDETPATVTIGPPGSAYIVKFSDGSDDALNVAVQNIPNPVLTVAFTDEGAFDHWSDLYPSVVVQTVVIATGR